MTPDIKRKLESLLRGRIDPVGSVSLSGVASLTVVTHPACNINSNVSITPLNAAAATEQGGGTLYVVPATGTFTVFHSVNSTARTLSYSILSRAVP
jgi:hypothetical protein